MSVLILLLNLLVGNGVLFISYVRNQTFPHPLTKEEEKQYVTQCIEGNKEARNTLIEHNLRLVCHLVKKFEKNNTHQDDLISIGIIGLIKAIDTYHPNKGTKLATYAARCIENEILMFFRQQKKTSKDTSLEDPLGHDKDGNAISLLDVLVSPNQDLDTQIQRSDDLGKISKYFSLLDKREKKVLIYRFGLFHTDEKTQREIAKALNISRSYVSRIEKRALLKLYQAYENEHKK